MIVPALAKAQAGASTAPRGPREGAGCPEQRAERIARMKAGRKGVSVQTPAVM